MGHRVAYKRKLLIGRAQSLLQSQSNILLIARGSGDYLPDIPEGYRFIVSFGGEYIVDYESNFIIGKYE